MPSFVSFPEKLEPEVAADICEQGADQRTIELVSADGIQQSYTTWRNNHGTIFLQRNDSEFGEQVVQYDACGGLMNCVTGQVKMLQE